jgi:hypothetical protein
VCASLPIEGNQDAVNIKVETAQVVEEDKAHEELLDKEAKIREKVDESGEKWRKVYFGGGPHFRNWLEQTLELCGKENVQVEEVDSKGFQCFEEAGEKMYRIWVKGTKPQK